MPSGLDWAAIARRLEEGDRVAFLELGRLITACLRQLRAYDFEDEWDDLRQEVCTAVLTNLRAGRLRDEKAFVGYVRVVTRNKFVDRLKLRIRHDERNALAWEEEVTSRVAPELAGPTGYDATLRGELLAALAALPDEERRLVTGVYVEGHTYQEMADRSGVALGTLKRRLRDGLAGLRTRLSERDPSALDPDRSHPLEPEPRGSDDPDSGGGETSRS